MRPYRLSYRDLSAMMAERDISVSHTTIIRWVQHYVSAFERGLRLLGAEDARWQSVTVRARRYLNNIIEQDHRAIKQRCAPMLGLKSFRTAAITFSGD